MVQIQVRRRESSRGPSTKAGWPSRALLFGPDPISRIIDACEPQLGMPALGIGRRFRSGSSLSTDLRMTLHNDGAVLIPVLLDRFPSEVNRLIDFE